jgi:hypothetical protein
MLIDLRAAGLLRTDAYVADGEAPIGRSDGRWDLWLELRNRANPEETPEWVPMTVRRVFNATGEPAIGDNRVELSFDHRLSQGAVVAAIRKLWPRLAASGWVHRTKRLADRNIALIRFVCLEVEPGTSWRAMLAAWNAARPAWSFGNVRDFQSAFHRVEKDLTDGEHGLEWFYSPRYRTATSREAVERLTVGQLSEMLKTDDPAQERRLAQRLHTRMARDAFESVRGSGFRYDFNGLARMRHSVHELAAHGFTVDEIAAQWRPDWFAEEPEATREIIREILRQKDELPPPPAPGEMRVDYADANRPAKISYEQVDEYDESSGYHIIGRIGFEAEEDSRSDQD